MTLKEAIVAKLTSTPAVTAELGDRVYPADRVPQDTALPYLVYEQVGRESVWGIARPLALANGRLRLVCYAATVAAAEGAIAAVRGVLVGFRGLLVPTFTVAGIFDTDRSDAGELPAFADELGRAGVAMDLDCWHQAEEG